MDRAEAIEVLKKTSDGIGHDEYGIYFTDKWVQAYEMAIAALREQEQREQDDVWQSVYRNLPDHGAMALCKTKYFYEVLQWDEKGSVWCGKDGVYGVLYVTHWMPLPEPPKGE